MSPFPPFAVARYGTYLAAAVAVISVWLGTRAGFSLDYAVLRSVFFFVIVICLAFGAEAVLLTTPYRAARTPESEPTLTETEPAE